MRVDASAHPKITNLSKYLDITILEALGIVHMLEQFAGKFCMDGALGKYTNQVIADHMLWSEKPGREAEQLIKMLVKAELLDQHHCCTKHRLIVHDWADNSPGWVKRKLKRKDIPFAISCDELEKQMSVSDRPLTDQRPVNDQPLIDMMADSDGPSVPTPEPAPSSASETVPVRDVNSQFADLFIEQRVGSGPFFRMDLTEQDRVRMGMFTIDILKTLGIPLYTTFPRNHPKRSEYKSAASTVALYVGQEIPLSDPQFVRQVLGEAHIARTGKSPVAVFLTRLRNAKLIREAVTRDHK